jgi:phage tail sheath protein FI
LNTLREFPGQGVVIWGARTLAGQDGQAPEWKYLNVRRLLLFIERSIDEGIRWAAFEPNAEPLWAKLRQTIGNFLTVLWRDGAFPGTRQEDAFFVKVDRSTMTQNDIDDGILNVLVGVAPVRAAEFVILRFGQRAVQPDP